MRGCAEKVSWQQRGVFAAVAICHLTLQHFTYHDVFCDIIS
jgi:hypothetical protein